MNNIVLSSEVEDWLSKLDNESIESLEGALAKLTVTILQAHPPLKVDLKYILRIYIRELCQHHDQSSESTPGY
ncbi:hypothetical protein BC936DRAFT_141101 [Jimgerdemannia flammicorona]|uniref:Uncharacterized protein n=1 Tax=Jimgerdemannia flammicorona TaxID=994334 RepID=A0A433DN45_9FUNG|nr:hypothetical protein BC936DRAFT_141101 [Jimgerdemannia flammicorona]